MKHSLVIACKAFLVAFALFAVATQFWVLPSLAADFALMAPELDYLRVPLLLVFGFAVALAEVVLVALWMLLSRISAGTIFSRASFHLVDVIVASFAGIALVFGGVFVYLLLGVGAGGPGVLLALLAGAAGATFAALVLLVMRGLLSTATLHESFIAEVV